MLYSLGSTSQSIDIQIVDDAGLGVPALVAATFPPLSWSRAGPYVDVAFPSLSDLALITSPWLAGGVKEKSKRYRLDLPNGIFNAAGKYSINGEASGKHVIVEAIEVEPLLSAYPYVDYPSKFTVATDGASTTTQLKLTGSIFQAKVGCLIWLFDPGTGNHVRVIESLANQVSNPIIGVKALPSIPDATWTFKGTLLSGDWAQDSDLAKVPDNFDKTQISPLGIVSTDASGGGGGGSGTGAFAVAVKVTSDGATPIVGATVRISGAQQAIGVSDSSGLVTFSLDSGTVTLSITAPGYSYLATVQVVSSTGTWGATGLATRTVTMTAHTTIQPSTDPELCNCYFVARTATGARLPGIVFRFTLKAPAGITDAWDIDPSQTATSDSNGVVQILLTVGAKWKLEGPDNSSVNFTPSGASYALPAYVGKF